ncbi:MAG TPA: hypothetical protein V6C65_38770 [Allocoleopsis sp.]
MDEMTNCYETDDLVESQFRRSWDSITEFYDGSPMRTFLGDPLANLMIQLVKTMSQAGYSQCLRAGQAMHQLILSRSREHGYLGGCYLCFSPEYGSYEVNGKKKIVQALKVTYYAEGVLTEEFEEDEIALTLRIQSFLQRLSEQPIT